MPPTLQVMVVEDDDDLRDDLVAILRKGGLVVEMAAGTIREGEDWIKAGHRVDVGLVDLGLPDGSGIELIARLRRLSPGTSCVAFTVFDAAETVFAALAAGAVGYLLKSTPADALTKGLIEAADGGAPMTDSIARLVVERMRNQEAVSPTGVETLSSRELEVLQLLAKGVSYGETARLLGVALGTIQTHVKAIYRKLDVSSKAEAAALAVRAGLSLTTYGSDPVRACA